MAFDEVLAARIRAVLVGEDAVTERKMFGGIAFMIGGNMACGVIHDDLMARVGPEAHDAAMARPNVRIMDFGHRPMKGMVYVGPEAITSDVDLERWVQECAAFARSLPPK